MSCVFIGDSLAVGTAHQRTECVNQAVGGLTTRQTIAQIQQIPVGSDQVIVSVGSNDLFAKGTTPDQRIRLYDSLRSGITAPSVVWILPNIHQQNRDAILAVARRHGDCVLDSRPLVSADGVHPGPAGYRNLARASENIQKSNSCTAK